MRQQYEADTSRKAGDGSGPRQQRDYSLKEGQTLRIALPDTVCSRHVTVVSAYSVPRCCLCAVPVGKSMRSTAVMVRVGCSTAGAQREGWSMWYRSAATWR